MVTPEPGDHGPRKRVLIVGANGGLGRNVVDTAIAAGHDVAAMVRSVAHAKLPAAATPLSGDATSVDDLQRCMSGRDVAFFCVNPPFSRWAEMFPPLLDACIEAAGRSGARLVFPGNVWIYGRGIAGQRVDEDRAPSPSSQRGSLRVAMEKQLAESGIAWSMVRLPEFYGPHVVTLTALIVRAALQGARALWPGPLDREIELIYLPDAGHALVAVGCDDAADGKVFHLPGVRTTARAFATAVFDACGAPLRIISLPTLLLRLAGVFDETARGAADIGHLWTHPIVLDGTRFAARYGQPARTSLAAAVQATVAWHRDNPSIRLQG